MSRKIPGEKSRKIKEVGLYCVRDYRVHRKNENKKHSNIYFQALTHAKVLRVENEEKCLKKKSFLSSGEVSSENYRR